MKAKAWLLVAAVSIGLSSLAARGQDAAPPANAPAVAKPTITKVNIHMKGAIAQDVFDELGKQGGIKFTNQGNLWDQTQMQDENDIDLTDRPFWSAVNEVCQLWNVAPQGANYGNNTANRVMLNSTFGQGARTKLPVFESDGFMVQALAFNRQQSVNYAVPQQSQNFCSLQLQVYVDPAIHISSMNQNARVEEAVDDAGNSMAPDKGNNTFYGGGQQRSLIYNCMVPLKYPDKPGKKIAHLKCILSMRGSDSLDSISIDKPLEAPESSKAFGETTVTFHSLKKNAQGTYELKLGITQDADQQGGNAWNLLQTAQLQDAKGHNFTYAGGGGGGGGQDDMVEYTINYMNNNNGQGDDAAAGEPVKWVLEMPTKTHAIRLPVEFSDLPLP